MRSLDAAAWAAAAVIATKQLWVALSKGTPAFFHRVEFSSSIVKCIELEIVGIASLNGGCCLSEGLRGGWWRPPWVGAISYVGFANENLAGKNLPPEYRCTKVLEAMEDSLALSHLSLPPTVRRRSRGGRELWGKRPTKFASCWASDAISTTTTYLSPSIDNITTSEHITQSSGSNESSRNSIPTAAATATAALNLPP